MQGGTTRGWYGVGLSPMVGLTREADTQQSCILVQRMGHGGLVCWFPAPSGGVFGWTGPFIRPLGMVQMGGRRDRGNERDVVGDGQLVTVHALARFLGRWEAGAGASAAGRGDAAAARPFSSPYRVCGEDRAGQYMGGIVDRSGGESTGVVVWSSPTSEQALSRRGG
jgi:hypothetical protein